MAGELVDPLASVRAYLAAEKSESTRRAYGSDWKDFTSWCQRVELEPLPAAPATAARYLSHLADSKLKASTIERRAAAIAYAHKAAGNEPPTNSEAVKAVMRGIRRIIGTKKLKKAPATAAAIAGMLEALSDTLSAVRDKALLLLAFAAALRRSELVGLDVTDLDRVDGGMIVQIRRSKTDQEGKGEYIPIPEGEQLKPVEAIEAWLKASAITQGPLFRSVDRHGNIGERLTDRSFARIIKRAARAAGLDAATFSGHSPRAGFITSALEDEQDLLKIRTHTRHASVRTLQEYDRRRQEMQTHVGKGFL